MIGKILVALGGNDRVEETIPCVEKLARPGMKVVFLLRYPVEFWRYFRDHWVTTESARNATSAGKTIKEGYSWEAQRALAEQLVAPARLALQSRKVEVEVNLYTGSLAKTVRDYRADKDIHWIVTKPLGAGRIGYLLTKAMIPLGWSSYLLSLRVFNTFNNHQSSRTTRGPRKQQKTTISENLIRAIRLTGTHDNLPQIVHALKNCMSVLLLSVGNLEGHLGHSVPDQQSLETLQSMVHEMNSLVEELVELVGR